MSADTIAAVATPAGRGPVGIVRLSGSGAATIAAAMSGPLPSPRTAGLRTIRDAAGDPLDEALVLFFPGPASFTGEDVVEIQAHGAPVVLEAIVDAACAGGARRARPGEFTERAFLNDRIDLAQAEAVADLVDAASIGAARAARASLGGAFSHQVAALAERLLTLRVQVEGALDFSDEDVDWIARGAVPEHLAALRSDIATLRADAARGARLAQGLTVVLAGPPNSGKSTLLNRLCGEELAIVTDVPGTTRDPLRHDLVLAGIPVRLIDTAGLRATDDVIEREGVARSRAQLAEADIVLMLVDDSDPRAATDDESGFVPAVAQAVLRVRNKIDASGRAAGAVDDGTVAISARDGDGIEALLAALRDVAGGGETEAPFSARARHLEALDRCDAALQRAGAAVAAGRDVDIAATELTAAHDALGQVSGAVDSEALLGAIFSRFCIGK